MPFPLVSVVVPVHNGERYVRDAIESVLRRGHRSLEVIVVDDGSTDGGASVAERCGPRVRVHRQDRAGAGAARNYGVRLARGAYLAFLDADDLWTVASLTSRLEALCADPSLDLVFGHVRHFVSPDLDPARASRIFCPPGAQPGYLPSCMLARREAVERVGPFREDLRIGEFVDWMARARECALREAMVADTVVLRRIHGANQGIRHRDHRGDFARVVKAALDRRRIEAGTGGA
jgi:glycosyltransferase involved in cell wall biosynthesis